MSVQNWIASIPRNQHIEDQINNKIAEINQINSDLVDLISVARYISTFIKQAYVDFYHAKVIQLTNEIQDLLNSMTDVEADELFFGAIEMVDMD